MTRRTLFIILAVVVLALLYAWGTYNRFITQNETVGNQWAQVETQYQRRFDLIPNLVSSVQGILKQEQKIFSDLAEARTRYANAVTGNAALGERVAAANLVEGALGRLIAIFENYPQLRSVETVQTLMAELAGAENRVSMERRRYNDAVRAFNVLVKRVPSALVASLFGFEEKTYFEAAPGAEEVPKVEL